MWNFEPGANPPLRSIVVSHVRATNPSESIEQIADAEKAERTGLSRAGVLAGIGQPDTEPTDVTNPERPPAAVTELKLTRPLDATVDSDVVPDPEPASMTDPAPKRPAGNDANSDSERDAEDVSVNAKEVERTKRVSARDVLEDAELEMLLASERGSEGRGR